MRVKIPRPPAKTPAQVHQAFCGASGLALRRPEVSSGRAGLRSRCTQPLCDDDARCVAPSPPSTPRLCTRTCTTFSFPRTPVRGETPPARGVSSYHEIQTLLCRVLPSLRVPIGSVVCAVGAERVASPVPACAASPLAFAVPGSVSPRAQCSHASCPSPRALLPQLPPEPRRCPQPLSPV